MSSIRLVPIGPPDHEVLTRLRSALKRVYRYDCEIATAPLDPAHSWNRQRQQYHSSELLARLAALPAKEAYVLGVTSLDLYMPILTFVFGEAELGGRIGIVSYHRLQQAFYGLPDDADLLDGRLLREAMHELGHNFGLIHCDDYECTMASSHAVESIDLKDAGYCASCSQAVPSPKRSFAFWK